MIPLIRESVEFAELLRERARIHVESRYKSSNRINLMYRFDDEIYREFESRFSSGLEFSSSDSYECSDVFKSKLSSKSILTFIAKVAVHSLFLLVGMLQIILCRSGLEKIARKCYVDDIDKVYQPNSESAVFYLVHPFPINMLRQIRFVGSLISRGDRFYFAGQRYIFRDILRVIRSRTVWDLYRAECRSSIRYIQMLKKLGVERLELSDEFDLSCLCLGRAARRYKIHTTNRAHGIGKYYPQICLDRFEVFNETMGDYYKPVFSGNEIGIAPNLFGSKRLTDTLTVNKPLRVNLVWISQLFDGHDSYLRDCEIEVIDTLTEKLSGNLFESFNLLYRPHPNRSDVETVPGWIVDRGRIPDGVNIIVSFFSTVHIDPDFIGFKYLLPWKSIQPQIAFGDDGPFLCLDNIVVEIREIFEGIDRDNLIRVDSQGRCHFAAFN